MIHFGKLKEKARISVQLMPDPDFENTVIVDVTAEYAGIEGHDYLNQVGCDSELEFMANSPYFEDMRQEALFDLAQKLDALRLAIDEVRDTIVWMRWRDEEGAD